MGTQTSKKDPVNLTENRSEPSETIRENTESDSFPPIQKRSKQKGAGFTKMFSQDGRVFEISEEFGLRIQNIMGDLYSPFITRHAWMWLRQNYETKSNDIFIVGYPRCGAHWVMKICNEIMKKADKQRVDTGHVNGNLADQIPWLESFVSKRGTGEFKKRLGAFDSSLRLWYTHSRLSRFPAKTIHPESRFIYVSRDPKDVCVSSHSLYVKSPVFGFRGSFSDYFNLFIRGLTMHGDYFTHTYEWYQAKYLQSPLTPTHALTVSRDQILFLHYEKMKMNPYNAVRSIASFMGKSDQLDEKDIESIIDESSFNKMKSKAKEMGGDVFYRKGKVGDFKSVFTEEQSRFLDEMVKTRFHDTNILYFQNLQNRSNPSK